MEFPHCGREWLVTRGDTLWLLATSMDATRSTKQTSVTAHFLVFLHLRVTDPPGPSSVMRSSSPAPPHGASREQERPQTLPQASCTTAHPECAFHASPSPVLPQLKHRPPHSSQLALAGRENSLLSIPINAPPAACRCALRERASMQWLSTLHVACFRFLSCQGLPRAVIGAQVINAPLRHLCLVVHHAHSLHQSRLRTTRETRVAIPAQCLHL